MVRAGNSNFAGLDEAAERAVEQLAGDLESGVWRARNRALLDLDCLDLGYRVLKVGSKLYYTLQAGKPGLGSYTLPLTAASTPTEWKSWPLSAPRRCSAWTTPTCSRCPGRK